MFFILPRDSKSYRRHVSGVEWRGRAARHGRRVRYVRYGCDEEQKNGENNERVAESNTTVMMVIKPCWLWAEGRTILEVARGQHDSVICFKINDGD